MLKSVVKKILKTANLEEVTMKTVCKQVRWLPLNLSYSNKTSVLCNESSYQSTSCQSAVYQAILSQMYSYIFSTTSHVKHYSDYCVSLGNTVLYAAV